MTWKLIRRNVGAKPFRFLLTASAVTIGVMFTVGVFVFTDSLRSTFEDLAGDIQSGFDLAVRSEIPFGERFEAPPVPVELADEVAAVDGVEAVQPRVLKFGAIPIDGEGEEQLAGQAPNIGINWEDRTTDPRLFLTEDGVSRAPTAPDEFALDVDAFEDGEFEIGETYPVLTPAGGRLDGMELVGTFTFGAPDASTSVGQKLLAFDTDTAVEVLNAGTGYDEITVIAEPDADIVELGAAIEQVLPAGTELVSREALAAEQESDFDDVINTFRTVLLVFAFIILAVSAFVIYNVFTILIGQRVRELGLLRAIGATGRQVTAALLGEALLVGVAATVIGTVAGIGLGWSLRWLLQQLDFGPEGTSLLLTPWTFVWGAFVGLGVTLASAVVPALRARDVSPMAALRDDARLTRRAPARNVPLGVVVLVASSVLLVFALSLEELRVGITLPDWALIMAFGGLAAFAIVFAVRRIDPELGGFALLGFGVITLVLALVLDLGTARVLSLLAVGAVGTFLGVAALGPRMARPAADLLGRWPLSLLVGVAGVLVVLLGAAGTIGAVALAAVAVIDLFTDPDLASVYGLFGAALLGVFTLGVLWVGVRSIDASLILGWRIRDAVKGFFVFLLGAIGAIIAVGGVATLVSGEVAGLGGIVIGVLLLVAARWLRRFLPERMKSNARMARENAARSPRRTASAAAALMIGLALVSTASVVASSFKATFAAVLEDSVTSDWFIAGNQFDPTSSFSADVGDELARLDEIDTVVRYRFSLEAFRTTDDLEVRDATATDLLLSLDHIDPDFDELDESLIARDAAFVHRDYADDKGFVIGSEFDVEFADQTTETLVVAGIYTDSAIYGNRAVDLEMWVDHFPTGQDQFLSLTTAEGVEQDRARVEIEAVTDAYPNLTVDTREEFQDRQEAQIDQFLTVINVLLLVAVVIALLGIAITLALSVFERTRELGLVRAVGMTSRQMMRMVLFEGAIIAAFGGVVGVTLGLLFGVAAVFIIPDSFIDTLGISVPQLAQYVVVAAVAGIGAAIIPARRASRLNVLEAISTE